MNLRQWFKEPVLRPEQPTEVDPRDALGLRGPKRTAPPIRAFGEVIWEADGWRIEQGLGVVVGLNPDGFMVASGDYRMVKDAVDAHREERHSQREALVPHSMVERAQDLGRQLRELIDHVEASNGAAGYTFKAAPKPERIDGVLVIDDARLMRVTLAASSAEAVASK